MLNYETLLSSYDDKLTLMQWLKKVEEALKGASAVSFKVNKRGDATLTFSVVFEDGSELETAPIILQQGESVQAATIRNGHLILTLTNGDELDAGNLGAVSGFSINASQHLIVTYQNGTTQDLGSIFSGNINIDGNFTANSIIENMSGYGYLPITTENASITYTYVGAVKNGNKVTFACSGYFSRSGDLSGWNSVLVRFTFPNTIGVKLYQTEIGGVSGLAFGKIDLCKEYTSHLDKPIVVFKDSNSQISVVMYQLDNTELDTPYLFRFEITFLLSDNLAG